MRLRIQAISDLPDVADQMSELIRLTKQQQDITRQAALQTLSMNIQQVDGIKGITDALKVQKKQQKETDDEAAAAKKEAAAANKKAASDIDELGKQIRSFGTLVAAAFTFNEIEQFGMDVIDAKTKIDSIKIALDVMLGSKAESAKLFTQIVDLAKKTPFTLDEVAENVVKLKAYNVATNDLIPTLTALGNMAAAVGKEKLPQITLAYGQVINTGRLMGGEIKQFIEAGIPLYDLLADSMKKPRQEVIKLAQDHQIMAEDVKNAIMSASEVGGKYYNMMVLQSKTLGGQISNLSDSYLMAKVSVGNFFEGSVAGGIGMLSKLIDATMGSNTAIARSIDIVKSITAAMLAYTVATNAQSVFDGISAAIQKARTIIWGENLLYTRANTAELIVYTAAETEAMVAAQAFNDTLKANWVGIAATAIIGAVSAVYAYSAATDEVINKLGEEELKLKSQQSELISLTQSAMLAADGTKERKNAIELLIQKYPEYFKGINAETVTNNQLKKILDTVNDSYRDRIVLARQAYLMDQANDKQQSVFQSEADLFDRVTRANVLNEEVVKSFGGSAQKLLEYMKANKAEATALNQAWTGIGNTFSRSIGQVATDLVKQQDAISKSVTDANKTITETNAQRIADDIKTENLRWSNQVENLKKGSAEYKAEEQKHLDALAKINNTYRETEIKTLVGAGEKMKQVTLLTANEIALIKKQGAAEEEMDRGKQLKAQLDFLNKQEDVEIAAVNKVKVAKDISNKALAALTEEGRQKIMAIEAKYDLKRAEVLEQIEVETQKNFLLKVQESNDKIALSTAKRLEAEKMLILLNDASTSTQRLAALKVFQQKYGDTVNAAAVDELRTQRDNSRRLLDDIIARDGEKGDAYRKAYAAWLKDNEQYNTALTKQTVDAAATTAKAIDKYEKEIQQSRKETAQLEKETLKEANQNRKEFINGLANLLGQDGGFMGKLAQGLAGVYSSIDGLQLKALDGAKENLNTARNNLAVIKGMYSDTTAEGAAAIAKGTRDVAQASAAVESARGVTMASALSAAGAIYSVLATVAAAVNARIAQTYKDISSALSVTLATYRQFTSDYQKIQQDSYKQGMASFIGSEKEKLAMIRDYYKQANELAKSKDRVENELAYYQKVAQIAADSAGDIKKYTADMYRLMESKKNDNLRSEIAAAERAKEEAADVRDAKLDYIDEVYQANKKAINKQIDDAKDAADKQKDIAEKTKDDLIKLVDDRVDSAKKAYDKNLENSRKAYDKEVDIVRKAYDQELELKRAQEAADRAEIQATYDLKKQLLDQATSDQIEEIAILERPRQEALARYEDGERTRIIATRERILATLTDEGERAAVTAEYDKQLRDLHTEVEDAKLDKTKGVSLATKQINLEQKEDTERLKQEETAALTNLTNAYQTLFKQMADERDQKLEDMKNAEETRQTKLKDDLTKLEEDAAADRKTINDNYVKSIETINNNLKGAIDKLTDALTTNEQNAALAKRVANTEYANAVKQLNIEIFEANKQLMIAQLKTEVAILEAKKTWTNDGKITAAQNQIIDIINQLMGTSAGIAPVEGLPEQVTGPNAGTPIYEAYNKEGKRVTIAYGKDHNITVYDKNGNEIQVKNGIGYVPETGEYFFKGTNFVEGLGLPDGRDTVPAMVNKGERIITTADNLAIGGKNLSNEQLIEKVKFHDLFMANYPKFMSLMMPATTPMQIPANIMNPGGQQALDMAGLRSDIARLNKTMTGLKQVHVNVNKHGLYTSVETHQSTVNYIANLQQQ